MGLPDEMMTLQAEILAIRDVVARLVAFEAMRWPEPSKIFENFSSATDLHLIQTQHGQAPGRGAMTAQEEIRRTVDWIVSSARTMAKELSEDRDF